MPSPEKPRIAICLEYSIMAFGGTEVLVRELVRGLSAHFAITLVSNDSSLEGTWAQTQVEQHLPWPMEGGGAELARRLRDAGVQLAHFHSGGNFGWATRRLGASPILQVWRAGIRCLNTNHGFFTPLVGFCAPYRPRWMKLALFPLAWLAKLQTVQALECEIAVSRHDERALRSWYWPQRGRFRQIYHSQLPPTPAPPAGARARQVLCVGTIAFRKGQQLLAEAFGRVAARFPDWELVFVGRIAEAEAWRRAEERFAAHGCAERVQRLDERPYKEVGQLMRASEIYVMPSQYEGLGLALQEALYHGCASVSTRSGGPEDLIEPEVNGLLVPLENPEALAAALARLMADEPLRERFRKEGPRSIAARAMNVEAMNRAYLALYREMLAP